MKRGFTIVEMLIIAPIVILVIGIFISAIVSMTGDALATRSSNALAYSIQDALNRIEQDIKSSGAFLATNNIALASPQGYDDDTANFHNADATNGTMLILNSYATDKNPLDPAQKKAYVSGQPIMINIVYFVKNGTLWRRVIVPSNYTATDSTVPWQQPSCAPDITDTPCKTQDTKLVDGINSSNGFSISYYPTAGSTVANTTASDSAQTDIARQTALQTTNSIKVTINATNSIAGRSISQAGTIQAVSPNNNISTTLISYPIKVLVVAGGGAGGGNGNGQNIGGGGGGGGGVVYNSSYPISNRVYSVIVGQGGTGSTGNPTNGGNSVFDSLTAIGGGIGFGWNGSTTYAAASGGSGGGGGWSLNSGASDTTGQGNNGGNGSSSANFPGGGGGGAGGAGQTVPSNNAGGNGGIGILNNIMGSSVYYGGGGGGGLGNSGNSGVFGIGVNGGGNGSASSTGASGAPNTGGGGGGAGNNIGSPFSNSPGGGGGSGIVIISYPAGSMTATGGTITTANGNTIHTFTSSGTFTIL